MAGTPKKHLDDSFVEGLACAICGEATLRVQHADSLPDYVGCSNCGAAFVVEDGGERVMYGKIPAEYPATSRFALRQWAWMEAVGRRAAAEKPRKRAGADDELELPLVPLVEPRPRPAPVGEAPPDLAEARIPEIAPPPAAETAGPQAEPEAVAPAPEAAPEPSGVAASRQDLLRFRESDDLISATPYIPGAAPPPEAGQAGAEGIGRPAPPVTPPFTELPPVEQEVRAAPSPEPPPGRRHRVVLTGTRVIVPRQPCAHCMRMPVRGKLAVVASPAGATSGRKEISLQLPLCADCHRRAAARGPDEQGQRVQALLISGVLGLAAIVAGLALGLVDLAADPAAGVFILGVLGTLGFALPLLLLLGRAGRAPLPADAVYVRTTLLIPRDVEGLASAFEWRNPAFARLFLQVNEANAVGGVVEIASPN